MGFSFPLLGMSFDRSDEKLGWANELVHGYKRFAPPSGSRSLGHPSFLLASNKVVGGQATSFREKEAKRGRGGVTFPEAAGYSGDPGPVFVPPCPFPV